MSQMLCFCLADQGLLPKVNPTNEPQQQCVIQTQVPAHNAEQKPKDTLRSVIHTAKRTGRLSLSVTIRAESVAGVHEVSVQQVAA